MGRFKNILLVSGGKRNVGKTTYICKLISLHKNKAITAVKITPHFHEITTGLQSISKGDGWILSKETNTTQKKDTSLYLKAGAKNSFFLQSEKEYLKEAFNELLPFLPQDNPIIIESAGLNKIIQPELYVVVLPDGECLKKEIEPILMLADLIVISDGKKFYPSPEKIIFDSKWKLNTSK